MSNIYNVKEVQDYIRRRKNLTAGQIELILRKNKIVIPKDFKTSFFKENFSKPISRVSKRIHFFKEDSTKTVSKVSRKISYFKEDSSRSISNFFYNLWKLVGSAGIGFLNILPKLADTYYKFFVNFFTELFSGIYNQQVSKAKTGKVLVGFFVIVGLTTIIISAITTFGSFEKSENKQVVKKEKIEKPLNKIEKKRKKEPKKEAKKQIKPKTETKKRKK